jgi:hypothetical protein
MLFVDTLRCIPSSSVFCGTQRETSSSNGFVTDTSAQTITVLASIPEVIVWNTGYPQ